MSIKWIGFLRIVVGVFFLAQGLSKVQWYTTSEYLQTNLDRYGVNAHPVTQWYQEKVARPYIEVWSRLIPSGEIAIGIALILGLFVQPTLIISSLLLLNFYVATGKIFQLTFFSDPYAMLLIVIVLLLLFNKSGNVWAVKVK